MIIENSMLNQKWVKILPHAIDTILLLSAVTLAVMINQYPFQVDWLTVKLVALIVYIILGTVALKRGKTKTIRCIALAGAVLTFAFMFSVAKTHNPLGLLG